MKYHALLDIFEKAAKFEIVICCKFKGGALRVNIIQYRLVSRKKVIDAYPESSKADFLHKEYLNIRYYKTTV